MTTQQLVFVLLFSAMLAAGNLADGVTGEQNSAWYMVHYIVWVASTALFFSTLISLIARLTR